MPRGLFHRSAQVRLSLLVGATWSPHCQMGPWPRWGFSETAGHGNHRPSRDSTSQFSNLLFKVFCALRPSFLSCLTSLCLSDSPLLEPHWVLVPCPLVLEHVCMAPSSSPHCWVSVYCPHSPRQCLAPGTFVKSLHMRLPAYSNPQSNAPPTKIHILIPKPVNITLCDQRDLVM